MIDAIQKLEPELRRWYLGALVGAITVDQQVNQGEQAALVLCLEEAEEEWRPELLAAVEELRSPSFVEAKPTVDRLIAGDLLKHLVVVAMADGHFDEPETKYITMVAEKLDLSRLGMELVQWAREGLDWQRRGEALVAAANRAGSE